MLQVKNLLCARGDSFILPAISFKLNTSQMLQIIGPNGSGKTTLLRTLAGLLRPKSGQVIGSNNGLSYCGHKSGLHPDLTLWQNLFFLQGLLPQAITGNKALNFALQYFQLEHKRNNLVQSLSSGELQRLNLSRLCLVNTKLWLLDEPLVHLDIAATNMLIELIDKHLENSGMVIISTHHDVVLNSNAKQILDLGALCAP